MINLEVINSTVAPTFDPNNLKRLGEIMDCDTIRWFTKQFMDSTPKYLADLRQLVDSGNADSLRRKAHKFKGESLQLGAIQLGRLCEQVEILATQGQLETMPANLAEIEAELARFEAILKSGGQL